ncbi:hypothetical protein ADH75_02870 [Flavonifractor plautii]|uniref:Coil containing protein n=1 Tax=Flavonifractor plautii TaxID=292800 RepID=A0AAX1KGG3_FLAPL|nr:hypothetical protein [Flavonifractor plautii]WAK79780.1 hypothetical protein [Flavonifractor phage Chenonceau]ANU42210.1 hypothetical protein A4U99_14550 [Flavonifractor plautii]OXE48533.1 hypothetical protein ADH75_02870 [Flavonifractor plautii]QQR04903.1 hypothetical protein I5Q84_13060 [Flavonifractor plautii]UQA25702.1 cell division protein ZapB [Flavonifractor plautii]
MDIEKLDINAVCFGILCNFTPVCGEERAKEAVELVRTLQAENEKLRADLEQVKRELDICIKAVFGDCDYCKYDRSLPDDTSPCWHCKEYAAQEFVTGNYWKRRGPEEG